MTFLVIGRHLASKVGSDELIRVKADTILGCDDVVYFLDEMVSHFRNLGHYTRNCFVDLGSTDIWRQGWIGSIGLGC